MLKYAVCPQKLTLLNYQCCQIFETLSVYFKTATFHRSNIRFLKKLAGSEKFN